MICPKGDIKLALSTLTTTSEPILDHQNSIAAGAHDLIIPKEHQLNQKLAHQKREQACRCSVRQRFRSSSQQRLASIDSNDMDLLRENRRCTEVRATATDAMLQVARSPRSVFFANGAVGKDLPVAKPKARVLNTVHRALLHIAAIVSLKRTAQTIGDVGASEPNSNNPLTRLDLERVRFSSQKSQVPSFPLQPLPTKSACTGRHGLDIER